MQANHKFNCELLQSNTTPAQEEYAGTPQYNPGAPAGTRQPGCASAVFHGGRHHGRATALTEDPAAPRGGPTTSKGAQEQGRAELSATGPKGMAREVGG